MNADDLGKSAEAMLLLRRFAEDANARPRRPRILGCRIEDFGPIENLSIELREGLNVLYGKNGAGKSQIIDAISQLASATTKDKYSGNSLFFEWTRPGLDPQLSPFENSEFSPWTRITGSPQIDDAYNLGLNAEEFPQWAHTFNQWAIHSLMFLALATVDENLTDDEFFSRIYDEYFGDDDEEKVEEDKPEEEPSKPQEKISLPISPITEALDFVMQVRGTSSSEILDYWDGPFRRHLFAMYHAATTNHGWTVPHEVEDGEDPLAFVDLSLLLLEAAVKGRFALKHSEGKLIIGMVSDVTPPSLMSETISMATSEMVEEDEDDPSMVNSLYEPMGEWGSLLFSDWHELLNPNWWEGIIWPTRIEAGAVAYVLRENELSLKTITTRALMHSHGALPDPEAGISIVEILRQNRENRSDLTMQGPDIAFDYLIDRTQPDLISEHAKDQLDAIRVKANEILKLLLETPPTLDCQFRPIFQWESEGVVLWSAIDQSGIKMPIDMFSFAQVRWIRFAVEIASVPGNCPIRLICLDEPEAGLHRRAEKYLASGLQKLCAMENLTMVVATHSPEFLGLRDIPLNHVHRDAHGKTTIERLSEELEDRIDDFGLNRSDLLQLCRLVLVVEGQHDLIVLQELIGPELRSLGVEIMALRGLKNLKNASDAQLLFRFTDADVMYLTDNEDNDRVNSIWVRAQSAPAEQALDVLAEFTRGSANSEAVFIKEFAALALDFKARERIHLAAVSKPDIIEYLPISHFVNESFGISDWETARALWEKSKTKKNFKSWLALSYGSSFDDNTIRDATKSMDHIPTDFTDLLTSVHNLLNDGK